MIPFHFGRSFSFTRRTWLVRGAVTAAAGAITACGSIPSAGPSRATIGEPGEGLEQDLLRQYFVVDVDERSLGVLRRRSSPTFQDRFAGVSSSARAGENDRQVQRVGIGDSLQISLWEAAAGGLFAAPALDRGGTGARGALIPEQQVGPDGAVTVPFAGRVRAAGRTTAEIERAIVERLEGLAVQPQALVTITRNLSNTATVLGEVTTGGRVPLTPGGNRLLDVIAAAGGIRSPPQDTFVRLSRGARTVSVPLQAVVQSPAENIPLRAGDVLTVVRQPQTFLAAGATGRNAIVPFEALGITLLEAVGASGGLLDFRADPAGVYVMRREPVMLAMELGAPAEMPQDEGTVRVVYRLNMTEPAAFFRGRDFRMRDKDVLYVASAPLNELQKILLIFNLTAQPFVTGATINNAVR